MVRILLPLGTGGSNPAAIRHREKQKSISRFWGLYHKTTYNGRNLRISVRSCLSLASLYSLVWCLWVRPELTRVKHLSNAPLQGKESYLISYDESEVL